jgi:hypothetical protein
VTVPDPQRIKDEEHLRLLGIFNYIFAGLSALTVLHGVLNIFVLRAMIAARATGEVAEESVETIGGMTTLIQVLVGVVIVLAAVLAFLSWRNGRNIRRRDLSSAKLVAVLQCLAFPLGTALGVFTFIVLGRSSVQQRYGDSADS